MKMTFANMANSQGLARLPEPEEETAGSGVLPAVLREGEDES